MHCVQDGNQAIHIAATAGHLNILQALIKNHNVSGSATNKVCIASYMNLALAIKYHAIR